MFEEIRLRLERAQADYRDALRQIDAAMKPIIAQHPEALETAFDIQAAYSQIGHQPAALTTHDQPPSPDDRLQSPTRLARHKGTGSSRQVTRAQWQNRSTDPTLAGYELLDESGHVVADADDSLIWGT